MPFDPNEKTRSVWIKKLIQKNITAQLKTKSIDSRAQQKNQQQHNPEKHGTPERAIRFHRRRCFQGRGDCANVHQDCRATAEPASLCVVSITKQAWKIKIWKSVERVMSDLKILTGDLRFARSGSKSLCESRVVCSARLQAGICLNERCPPEGGRYTNRIRVTRRNSMGDFYRRYRVAVDAATHKIHL